MVLDSYSYDNVLPQLTPLTNIIQFNAVRALKRKIVRKKYFEAEPLELLK